MIKRISILVLTLLTNLSVANADPAFVANMTKQIREGISKGALITPARMRTYFENICAKNAPDVQKTLDTVNQFVHQRWTLDRKREFERDYRANFESVSDQLAPVFDRINRIDAWTTGYMKRHELAAVSLHYGTHCDWNLVDKDVEKALIDSNYVQKPSKKEKVNFGDYYHAKTPINKSNPNEKDLAIILTWGENPNVCLLEMKNDLNSTDDALRNYKKDVKRRFRAQKEAAEEARNEKERARLQAEWEKQEAIKNTKFKRDLETLKQKIRYEEIQAKVTESLFAQGNIHAIQNPMPDLRKEYYEILGIEAGETFNAEEKPAAELNEITPKLKSLLIKAQARYDTSGLEKEFSWEVPVMDTGIGRLGDRDTRLWWVSTEDLATNSIHEVRKALPEGVVCDIHHVDLKSLGLRMGLWMGERVRGREYWTGKCALARETTAPNSYEGWKDEVETIIRDSETRICVLDERAHKNDEQFSGSVMLVPAASILNR